MNKRRGIFVFVGVVIGSLLFALVIGASSAASSQDLTVARASPPTTSHHSSLAWREEMLTTTTTTTSTTEAPTTVVSHHASSHKTSPSVVAPTTTVVYVPPPAGECGAGGTADENQTTGHCLMLQRWPDAQWSCLQQLWGPLESRWNQHAANGGSSAYGIPQSLAMNQKQANAFGHPELAGVGGSKMATAGLDFRDNPVTQITWGLNYVGADYGTPCHALSERQRKGWY